MTGADWSIFTRLVVARRGRPGSLRDGDGNGHGFS